MSVKTQINSVKNKHFCILYLLQSDLKWSRNVDGRVEVAETTVHLSYAGAVESDCCRGERPFLHTSGNMRNIVLIVCIKDIKATKKSGKSPFKSCYNSNMPVVFISTSAVSSPRTRWYHRVRLHWQSNLMALIGGGGGEKGGPNGFISPL